MLAMVLMLFLLPSDRNELEVLHVGRSPMNPSAPRFLLYSRRCATLAGVLCLITGGVLAAITAGSQPVSAQGSDGVISELVVTGQGIGPFLLGATADELVSAAPEGWTIGPKVPVDLGDDVVMGHVVRFNEQPQFLAFSRVAAAERLDFFRVSNDSFSTDRGARPGDTVEELAALYGSARTTRQVGNGRLEVGFSSNPDRRLRFVTGSQGPLSERQILSIDLRCVAGVDCPGDPNEAQAMLDVPAVSATAGESGTSASAVTTALAQTGISHQFHVVLAATLLTLGAGLVRTYQLSGAQAHWAVRRRR